MVFAHYIVKGGAATAPPPPEIHTSVFHILMIINNSQTKTQFTFMKRFSVYDGNGVWMMSTSSLVNAYNFASYLLHVDHVKGVHIIDQATKTMIAVSNL